MDQAIIRTSRAWPIIEAMALLQRVEKNPPPKGFVLFETGYGPSGLPHIGTFAEVFRTTLIRRAFSLISDIPTELYAFSDDMDGLRKVPDNVPNAEMLQDYLQKPLTSIPDPFGTHDSYGHHMNARLQAFLDAFGFDYSFKSATDCYRAGLFDDVLLRVVERHEAICNVVKPHLGAERRATYSPILPISPKTGRVLQVPLEETHPDRGTIVFRDEDGTLTEIEVTGGACKLQWRADWALRWTALEVDYEMSGKDLIDSVKLGSQICRIMGGTPPNNLTYELFLDQNGEKISKSRGNGLTIEEWLRYGTRESLQLFLYQSPKKAKRLYFDVIPRQVDDYQSFIDAWPEQDDEKKLGNPVWHIHAGHPPAVSTPVSFTMLLNLAAVVNAEEPSVLWSFIQRYAPDCTPQSNPYMATLVDGAIAYYQDRIKPEKAYREPDIRERAALLELRNWLSGLPAGTDGRDIQNEIYEIGKRHRFDNLRDWFKVLYEVLLGQSEGPRFGSFVEIYGLPETVALIDAAIDRGSLADAG
ncbi:MAG: lysine--tRNA ligase [Geminicoccaceae bacterium]